LTAFLNASSPQSRPIASNLIVLRTKTPRVDERNEEGWSFPKITPGLLWPRDRGPQMPRKSPRGWIGATNTDIAALSTQRLLFPPNSQIRQKWRFSSIPFR
jgi:hypothetical protein